MKTAFQRDLGVAYEAVLRMYAQQWCNVLNDELDRKYWVLFSAPTERIGEIRREWIERGGDACRDHTKLPDEFGRGDFGRGKLGVKIGRIDGTETLQRFREWLTDDIRLSDPEVVTLAFEAATKNETLIADIRAAMDDAEATHKGRRAEARRAGGGPKAAAAAYWASAQTSGNETTAEKSVENGTRPSSGTNEK